MTSFRFMHAWKLTACFTRQPYFIMLTCTIFVMALFWRYVHGSTVFFYIAVTRGHCCKFIRRCSDVTYMYKGTLSNRFWHINTWNSGIVPFLRQCQQIQLRFQFAARQNEEDSDRFFHELVPQSLFSLIWDSTDVLVLVTPGELIIPSELLRATTVSLADFFMDRAGWWNQWCSCCNNYKSSLYCLYIGTKIMYWNQQSIRGWAILQPVHVYTVRLRCTLLCSFTAHHYKHTTVRFPLFFVKATHASAQYRHTLHPWTTVITRAQLYFFV